MNTLALVLATSFSMTAFASVPQVPRFIETSTDEKIVVQQVNAMMGQVELMMNERNEIVEHISGGLSTSQPATSNQIDRSDVLLNKILAADSLGAKILTNLPSVQKALGLRRSGSPTMGHLGADAKGLPQFELYLDGSTQTICRSNRTAQLVISFDSSSNIRVNSVDCLSNQDGE